MPQVEKLSIFLASPGDVPFERRYVEQIIAELNLTVASDKRITLQVMCWENNTFPGYGQDAQALINAQVAEMAKYSLFIGIMWNRLGTPTPRAASGTVEEFERAVAALRQNAQPEIWFYFRQSAAKLDTEEELEQRKKVLDFKKQVQTNGMPWSYNKPADFRDKLRNQLTLWLNARTQDNRTMDLDPFGDDASDGRIPIGQEEQPPIKAESEMESLFINSFPEYCAYCAKMMSRATAEVRTVQTPSRGVGELTAFRQYLSVTADKIVLPSGPPTFGVSLYHRLVVVDATSYESEFKKLKVFFEALRDAIARANKEDVRELDLSCLGLCIVHRETMARFFHSNLDVHITGANECAVAFQRPQTGRGGPENLWQTCLYARLGTQSNAERLIQSFDQVWTQGAILGGEVLAETIGPQVEHLGKIASTTLTVLRDVAYGHGHIDVTNRENANVRKAIEKSKAYSNRFFEKAKEITVKPQALAPLVREWHAITRAFALQTPQYVALIAKECLNASSPDQARRFERALQIASSISAGEFGIGVPLSNQIHFRLFSELSSIVGIADGDLHGERVGTWQETKAVIDLFESSFTDLRRGAGVLCTIEVTAFHIVDAMRSLFKGHSTSYVDLHLEIEQSHAELADEMCRCIRAARRDVDEAEILQGAKDLCDALGRFWDQMAEQVFL